MDILSMLESAASEIRELRNRAASDETMRKNQTLRVAISQLRGNIIDYSDADKMEWDALNELIDAGRVTMAHTGEVLCDMQVLTKDQLRGIIESPNSRNGQTYSYRSYGLDTDHLIHELPKEKMEDGRFNA